MTLLVSIGEVYTQSLKLIGPILCEPNSAGGTHMLFYRLQCIFSDRESICSPTESSNPKSQFHIHPLRCHRTVPHNSACFCPKFLFFIKLTQEFISLHQADFACVKGSVIKQSLLLAGRLNSKELYKAGQLLLFEQGVGLYLSRESEIALSLSFHKYVASLGLIGDGVFILNN